jgi:hypothetical protein
LQPARAMPARCRYPEKALIDAPRSEIARNRFK